MTKHGHIVLRFFAPLTLGLTLVACGGEPGNGQAAEEPATLSGPFAGTWMIARPDGPGVIVNEPIISCDNPLMISTDGDNRIILKSPEGEPQGFELSEISRGLSWFPDDMTSPLSFISETKSSDKFWVYTVNVGTADWDNPQEYTRCEP